VAVSVLPKFEGVMTRPVAAAKQLMAGVTGRRARSQPAGR
jgi:hypothetical protein